MEKKKRSRSFRKELIYSFLTVSLVSILFLGAFQIYQLSSLIDENQKSQAQTTQFLEDYIISYVQEYQKAIETKIPDIKRNLKDRNYDIVREQLQSIKNNYPGFVNLYVGDQDGKSLVFYPEVSEDGAEVRNQDFSDRQYYKELVQQKDTVISSAFIGRGGTDKMLVTLASPLLDDQENMEGYILGALDLTALEEHIKNRSFGKEGYAVVLDQNNNVVVHPEIDPQTELVNMSDDPIVKYIRGQYGGAGGEYFTPNGAQQKEYITYEKIDAFNGWTVWVGKPASVISNTYTHAIMTIIIFILITAVFMIGISFVLSERLEKSLRNLLEYIKDYTRAYKEKTFVTKRIEGPKEMEELSLHFNKMIHEVEKNRQELIHLNSELESRVQDRTADLRSKNMELRAVNKLITSVSTEKDITHFIQHCLRQIEPFMNYSIHILFQGYAVTNESIQTKQSMDRYLNDDMRKEQQYIEPIHITSNQTGFLIVDLHNDQLITADDKEFLQTFASSLSIMLQNKLLFERFRNKHAELEAVLESMSEGIMLLNNDRMVDYVNEFFQKEVNGTNHYKTGILHINDVYERFIASFDVSEDQLNAFFDNGDDALKLEKVLPSGKVKYYMLHKFSVISDEEQIGEGLLLRDITKEEEIDTLKNNLISLTSHEFKTPITNIKGSVETLLRSEVEWEPEFQQELLEGVHEDIDRIQHLVSDWMDISKIESGAMYIVPNIVRADHVIEESIAQVPDVLQEDAEFNFTNKLGDKPYFYADKIRVQQVLINLFTNALRYNDETWKKIDITLSGNDENVIVSVQDNGIGISQDDIQKIFNRFYQVDATATRRTGGTGLGLAICQGIMEAHEGSIEVDSVLGEGSTFKLYFPVKEET
ncbi:Drug sensory protein [Lentibacillus sp. JNUCC-1]|uniref:ATP-binding protein n=1 Tax=Lentibacillus sp. JNUCC-1 TaxID=2654513 RepID=UPI0012E745E7|nr:ATP-binding protein [Lentibacillus sp. JNUCC-1]MUV38289.1 Drug sensory protein [Lentibacillus sp. JNUCC-1]